MANDPWSDLRDDMIRVARQGIAHNFAYHPGSGGGAPLLALDKLRPFNNKRASEALTQLRTDTLEESEKGKPQPGLSGFVWGQVNLVQQGSDWILRFTSLKKPQPVIVTTFVRRLRILNKFLKGCIPSDLLKTAEIVYGEDSATESEDLAPLRKRLDALSKAVADAGTQQASLDDRADRLASQQVGGLEDLLYEDWPSEAGAPEELETRLFELANSVNDLPGQVGAIFSEIMKVSDPLADANDLMEEAADPTKQGAAIRGVTKLLDGLDKRVSAVTDQVGRVSGQLGKLTTAYTTLRADILAARKKLRPEEREEDLIVPLPANWGKLRKTWDDAIDKVNTQITALQNELRKHRDDVELQQIAEVGLNAITNNHRVPLMAAMLEVESTEGKKRRDALTRLSKAADDFANHLATDPRVAAVDDNPWKDKAPVAVVDTLVEPLMNLASLAA